MPTYKLLTTYRFLEMNRKKQNKTKQKEKKKPK